LSSPDSGLFAGRQPNQLIGREDEATAIKEKLLRPEVRLLTLTGAPGIGKTRLAISVSNDIRPAFAETTFVYLTPISNPAQMLPVVARSCGVLEGVPGFLSERLCQAISSRRLLVVVDKVIYNDAMVIPTCSSRDLNAEDKCRQGVAN